MANYTIPENPIYTVDIRKLERSDPASAELFNTLLQILIENTHAVKREADSAARLANARTIRTNLANTSAASFDGTENITPGITGTLPVANGGTGGTTAANACTNLGALSKSGGTMTGILYAQTNASYTTAQMRNISANTTDLTAGSSSLANGSIYLVYE